MERIKIAGSSDTKCSDRLALLKATPMAALEIVTNVVPIHPRLHRLLAIEYIRLLCKDYSHPLKIIAMRNHIRVGI